MKSRGAFALRLIGMIFIALSTPLDGDAEPFRNLSFEDYDIGGLQVAADGFYHGSVEKILPGWEVSGSGIQPPVDIAVQSGENESGYHALIVRPNSLAPKENMATLFVHIRDPVKEIRLKQTGEFPENASRMQWITSTGPYVLIDGKKIPDLGDGFYRSFDISEYRSKEVTMEWVFPDRGTGFDEHYGIDFFQYVKSIPEPSTYGLLMLGGLSAAWVVHARRRPGPTAHPPEERNDAP